MSNMNCPICNSGLTKAIYELADGSCVECPRCGPYKACLRIDWELSRLINQYPHGSAILSHVVLKMHKKSNDILLLTYDMVENILKNNSLPKVNEQIENLIIFLCEKFPVPGVGISFQNDEFIPVIGAVSGDNETFILESMNDKGLIDVHPHSQGDTIVITYEGWEFYGNLIRGAINSRKAFMAMPFGDKRLNKIFLEVFKPAVKETGYELESMNEAGKAGLIDDNMRVAIATSRFLVAELTDDNSGAYWEAGYAEGLGKPVIYTCEEKKFKEKTTHFDTNHHLTVLWSEDDMNAAAKKLKSTIRATLPGEAK